MRYLLLRKKFQSMILSSTILLVVDLVLSVSDMIIAGNMFGESGLAAVMLIMPLTAIADFISKLSSVGAGILFTQNTGSDNKPAADRVCGTALIMSIGSGIIMFTAAFLLKDAYLGLFDISAKTAEMTGAYYNGMMWMFLLKPLFYLINTLVIQEGDEETANLSFVLHLVSDILLSIVFAWNWGMAGLGYGSSLGLVICIILLFFHMFKKSNTIKFRMYFTFGMMFSIAKYSIVDASVYLYEGIIEFAINILILIYFGERYLSIYSALTILMELEFIFEGIGDSLTPLVNMYRGEGNRKGEARTLKYCVVVAIIEGIAINLLIFIFAPLIVNSLGIDSSELVSLASYGLRIVSFGSVFTALTFVIVRYYLVTGRIGMGWVTITLRDLILPVLLACLLVNSQGVYGLFGAFMLAPIITSILLTGYMILKYGINGLPAVAYFKIKNEYLESLVISEESVLKLTGNAGKFLEEWGISEPLIEQAKMLCSEQLRLIWERNEEKTILAEVWLLVDKEEQLIRIVIKDQGEIFNPFEDISAAVNGMTSEKTEGPGEAGKMAACTYEMCRNRRNMITVSFNRNVFELPMEGSGTESQGTNSQGTNIV